MGLFPTAGFHNISDDVLVKFDHYQKIYEELHFLFSPLLKICSSTKVPTCLRKIFCCLFLTFNGENRLFCEWQQFAGTRDRCITVPHVFLNENMSQCLTLIFGVDTKKLYKSVKML